MLDWLIIGGGIHGTHHSYYLTRVRGFSRERVRVLDPHDQPLALWDQFTANTGMQYLRSPHVQSLDHDPWSISTFAKTRAGTPLANYIPTHNRPSLALFKAHSNWMIAKHQLDAMRIQGRAQGLEKIDGGWRVETDDGALEARRVLLAIGATEQPRWSKWAKTLRAAAANVPIEHMYDPSFDLDSVSYDEHIVVIGSGISAGQLALALGAHSPGNVTLVMRHEARIFPFDSDLCWVNAGCLDSFHKTPDFDARREIIRQARHTGSMPAEVQSALNQAKIHGRLNVCIGEITGAMLTTGGIALTLQSGTVLNANRVILATGFEPVRPGGAWLDTAVDAYGLPTASCGYPIVDATLRWADGLHVSGPLAELEIGPAARNIIGARLAAERIARSA